MCTLLDVCTYATDLIKKKKKKKVSAFKIMGLLLKRYVDDFAVP